MWDHALRMELGGEGGRRVLPNVADNSRKWEQINRTLAAKRQQRHSSVSLYTESQVRSICPRSELAANITMSVLCYNKGCGQRFDPENNKDGESCFREGSFVTEVDRILAS